MDRKKMLPIALLVIAGMYHENVISSVSMVARGRNVSRDSMLSTIAFPCTLKQANNVTYLITKNKLVRMVQIDASGKNGDGTSTGFKADSLYINVYNDGDTLYVEGTRVPLMDPKTNTTSIPSSASSLCLDTKRNPLVGDYFVLKLSSSVSVFGNTVTITGLDKILNQQFNTKNPLTLTFKPLQPTKTATRPPSEQTQTATTQPGQPTEKVMFAREYKVQPGQSTAEPLQPAKCVKVSATSLAPAGSNRTLDVKADHDAFKQIISDKLMSQIPNASGCYIDGNNSDIGWITDANNNTVAIAVTLQFAKNAATQQFAQFAQYFIDANTATLVFVECYGDQDIARVYNNKDEMITERLFTLDEYGNVRIHTTLRKPGLSLLGAPYTNKPLYNQSITFAPKRGVAISTKPDIVIPPYTSTPMHNGQAIPQPHTLLRTQDGSAITPFEGADQFDALVIFPNNTHWISLYQGNALPDENYPATNNFDANSMNIMNSDGSFFSTLQNLQDNPSLQIRAGAFMQYGMMVQAKLGKIAVPADKMIDGENSCTSR